MSDLVGNPEDRFSHNGAELVYSKHSDVDSGMVFCFYCVISLFDIKASEICYSVLQGKGKGKKKASSMSLDWPRERESGMKTLLNLISLNIQRLWDPPIAEDEFVR